MHFRLELVLFWLFGLVAAAPMLPHIQFPSFSSSTSSMKEFVVPKPLINSFLEAAENSAQLANPKGLANLIPGSGGRLLNGEVLKQAEGKFVSEFAKRDPLNVYNEFVTQLDGKFAKENPSFINYFRGLLNNDIIAAGPKSDLVKSAEFERYTNDITTLKELIKDIEQYEAVSGRPMKLESWDKELQKLKNKYQNLQSKGDVEKAAVVQKKSLKLD